MTEHFSKSTLAAVLTGVFLLGFASGFEVCILTLVKRAIGIAKSAIATADELLAILKEVQAALKDQLLNLTQERTKPTKRTVH
jgi:hypothetical protein